MKTTFTLILVACALLAGCKSTTTPLTQEEEKLVGEYYFSETKDLEKMVEGMSATFLMEGYTEYNSDRTCENEGTVKIVMVSKNIKEVIINVQYKFSSEGNWKIENGELMEVANPESFRFELSKSDAKSEAAKKAVKVLERASGMIASLIKDSMMKSENAKIIELTDTKLVMEQDGQQYTATKIK